MRLIQGEKVFPLLYVIPYQGNRVLKAPLLSAILDPWMHDYGT